jgi:hypothetical protein
MAEKTDMNALLRASRGIVVEDGKEKEQKEDMNALIRRGFGVRVKQEEVEE